ncbi:hypothetical protein PICMEDRAFT_71132 [Pichia membranifaciens NRRL Y-2026]|uniref:Uncharacterized protein n=1 Tax=Pichia membranifaciens NRRL Y-2026 TaxID=763406 RepID=A0A1E3NVA0_9ASCO|nr:hypothetical protein PICMEDRAFT_71132 [Pichia membranifaciens NRRL Y-2026]ODQ49588.1 hypothetical protein PICMEDRAFT_71132 [Pichia membranifaciens NRRL Y-2026]
MVFVRRNTCGILRRRINKSNCTIRFLVIKSIGGNVWELLSFICSRIYIVSQFSRGDGISRRRFKIARRYRWVNNRGDTTRDHLAQCATVWWQQIDKP